MEVINLDTVDLSEGNGGSSITLNKGDSVSVDISSSSPSMAGAELLMNHNTKKRSGKMKNLI